MATARAVLINIALLLGAVVGLELIFGDWIGRDSLNHLHISRNVDAHYDVTELYSEEPHLTHRTRDRYGFGGKYADPAKIDILTLGGSTTNQLYLSDEDTWQNVLVRELARRGKKISVVNAGLEGQSSLGHIRDFDFWFPKIPNLRAKYVLVYVGINDVFVSPTYPTDLLKNDFLTTVAAKSAIVFIVQTIRGALLSRRLWVVHRKVDFAREEYTELPRHQNHAAMMGVGLDAYRDRLRELARRIGRFGAVPIFVTQVSRAYRWVDGRLLGLKRETPYYGGEFLNGVDMYYVLDATNRVTMEVCRRVGGVCIDLAKDLRDEFRDSDFYDLVHNTPSGARKIGEYLSGKLAGLPFD